MRKLEIGATVRIRSGGPALTVISQADENGFVNCLWFDRDHQIRSYSFHLSVLVLISPSVSYTDVGGDGTIGGLLFEQADVFDEYGEDNRYSDYDDGCGEGPCSQCENVGCNSHPSN